VIQIIPLSGEHIDSICEIENESFGDPWSRGLFLDLPDNPFAVCFTAVDIEDTEVVGYLIGSGVDDEYSIYNISIKQEYQRRGYASFLLDNMFKKHAGVYKDYFLEVRESNISAIKFYEKFDFKVIYTRKGYYTNPVENALVMRLAVRE